MQYNSMQPQDIVEHEEKRRVNALLQREKLIRDLGITDQLSRLLPTAEGGSLPHLRIPHTQGSCTLRSQVMGLPEPPHTAKVEGWREVNWALSISGGAGWGSAAGGSAAVPSG